MGMQNELVYKPAIIGCERLPEEVESRFYRSKLSDVEVYTDSGQLLTFTLLSGATTDDKREPLASLYYATEEELSFKKKDGSALSRMEIDYPGDIYVSPNLDKFYFNGIEKMGTLAGMVYETTKNNRRNLAKFG